MPSKRADAKRPSKRGWRGPSYPRDGLAKWRKDTQKTAPGAVGFPFKTTKTRNSKANRHSRKAPKGCRLKKRIRPGPREAPFKTKSMDHRATWRGSLYFTWNPLTKSPATLFHRQTNPQLPSLEKQNTDRGVSKTNKPTNKPTTPKPTKPQTNPENPLLNSSHPLPSSHSPKPNHRPQTKRPVLGCC